jgi:hypothetical protein
VVFGERPNDVVLLLGEIQGLMLDRRSEMKRPTRQRVGLVLSSLLVGVAIVNIFDIGRTFTISLFVALAMGAVLFGLSELVSRSIARR